jgi:hypothetical protein
VARLLFVDSEVVDWIKVDNVIASYDGLGFRVCCVVACSLAPFTLCLVFPSWCWSYTRR